MYDFALYESLHTPLFWVNKEGLITWKNKSATAQFEFLEGKWEYIRSQLPEGYIFHIHENGPIEEGFLVECIANSSTGFIDHLHELRESNKQLELIIAEAFDEIYVTDSKGITLRVNKAAERFYGIPVEDLIGKSVFDLEREGVFYPSVTGLAIRHQKQVTFLQTIKGGKQLMATANPVFNEDGDISLVISTAREMNEALLTTDVVQDENYFNKSYPSASDSRMITQSPSMRSVMVLARRVAVSDATILLLGETGVGKNRMAEFIHEQSSRNKAPFIHVNCAAIPPSLFESELFGYESGAFTGAVRGGRQGKLESANHGTLFLNEIGELPLELQSKLLDFIQQKSLTRIGGTRIIPIDVRIIAATNRNLEQMVHDGTFRADLYYRLHVVPLEIPPLRDRLDDIPQLAHSFIEEYTNIYPQAPKQLAPEVEELFMRYSWPGNVRELENLLECLAVTVEDNYIQVKHLPSNIRNPVIDTNLGRASFDTEYKAESPLKMLERLERSIYDESLKTYRSTYEIARALQVSQATVVRKIKQFNLRAET